MGVAPRVAIAINTHPADERLSRLAAQLGLPLCQRKSTPCELHDYHLQLSPGAADNRLELSAADPALGNPLCIDFVGGALAHRRQYGGGRGQALARAIGLKKSANPTVVDATGGTGRDAYVLATLGIHVTLLERSPVLCALLEDALTRAVMDTNNAPIIQRLHLIHTDAITWLKQCPTAQRPDVVYLDPMYPHRSKSALVKKEMRFLRGLVGDDDDADQLLLAALACARKRIVVKRPKGAPIIQGIGLENVKPSSAVESKNTRYDLYPIL